MRLASIALMVLAFGLVTSSASAHSEQRLPGGDPVRWHRRAVAFVVDPTLFDPDLADPVDMVTSAASAWEGIGHVPRFEVRRGALGAVGYDPARVDGNVSGIALYRRDFPQRLDRAVLALTLLTRNSATGEIVDADVILDAERNRFRQLTNEGMLGLPGAPNDYQNVITHEFGHVLGLIEDPDHADSTMFPSSQPGEVSKRRLSHVDVESAARAYPTPPSTLDDFVGGCGGGARVSPRATGRGALAAFAVALLCVGALRARRPRLTVFVAGAILLALGAPEATPRTTLHGLVLRAETHPRGGVLVTRALVATARGTVRVERLGGRLGAYEQRVLDAPSGTELRPGASVDVTDAQ